jgi:hypothetical protein
MKRVIAAAIGACTYCPTYAQVLLYEEANHEFELNSITDGGCPVLAHQEYWTTLSDGTGQLYWSKYAGRLSSAGCSTVIEP